ncbi:NosD domain-containing protein [Bacillus sp. B15-48]|uniref:right-handed parallel beta-helix repeat-containing protein n=1 Tax=Bacillus sp. B15-48 TaxID=1548601 RepID=UPI00193F8FEE|nr:NosD domain-containing protein [Bacillus sp. B15-48]MBM4763811.1 hypothetical protein [Bacillus sp. B15-48]
MKLFRYMILLLLSIFISMPSLTKASSTLQAKIDQASEGATLEIEEGEYEERLVISKPITVIGKGEVIIRSCEAGPVLTVSGTAVTLKNIKVEHCGTENADTAMFITGSHHLIEGIGIETRRFGMKLDEANGVTIKDSEIIGRKRGNGVDFWRSNGNQLENLKISNASDGIYLEQSNENIIEKTDIENSRYGMHLMFSNDNVLRENQSRLNITGAMVMESKRTKALNNTFLANKNNVNAQGLLLYAVSDTEVIGNEITSNRVGVYVERAENNYFELNKIMDNFIGIQLNQAAENKLTRNTFVGNVNEAQAIESSNNELDKNYWDSASMVDINRNGESEISYTADPYFLTLTTRVPEYQLFFQAPGMILLQNLLKSPPEQLLTDSAPLMNMTVDVEKETSASFNLWIISIMMMIASISLFILGRKKS